jgi:hypothetical protein
MTAKKENETPKGRPQEPQQGQPLEVEPRDEKGPGEIDLATVNRFKALSAPCLVCGKMPPGLAYGITPDQAVCADDYTDNPDEAKEALEAAQRGDKPKYRKGRTK